MTKYLIYLFLILLPLGRVFSVPVLSLSGGRQAPLTLMDVGLALLLFSYFVKIIVQRRLPQAFKIRGIGWFALFPLWIVVSLAINAVHFHLSSRQILQSVLYFARWLECAALFFVIYDEIYSLADAKRIFRLLMGGALVCAIFGFFQSVFLPDFALMLHPEARPYIDFDPQGHRLVSTLLDPNIAAGYFLMFALVCCALYFHRVRGFALLAGVFFAALLVTLSRGGIVGFAAGLLALIGAPGFPKHRLLVPILLMIAVAAGLVPILDPQVVTLDRLSISDESATNRFDQWKLLQDIITDNPVSGIGFNTYPFVAPLYGAPTEGALAAGAEGDILFIAALTGGIGLLLFFAICYSGYQWTRRLRQNSFSPWDRALGLGLRAAMVGVFVNGMFSSNLLFPMVMATLWCLLALVAVRNRAADAEIILYRGLQQATPWLASGALPSR